MMVVLLAVLLAAADVAGPEDGCSKDVDCKGARVCVQRECVDPTPETPAEPQADRRALFVSLYGEGGLILLSGLSPSWDPFLGAGFGIDLGLRLPKGFALVAMAGVDWATLHNLTTTRLATIGLGLQIEKRMRIPITATVGGGYSSASISAPSGASSSDGGFVSVRLATEIGAGFSVQFCTVLHLLSDNISGVGFLAGVAFTL